jgi:hypothetical protein
MRRLTPHLLGFSPFVAHNRAMFKTPNSERKLVAVLSRSDLRIVDKLASRAGISRQEALLQLLRFQLDAPKPTRH